MIFERRQLCRKCEWQMGNRNTPFWTHWCHNRYAELAFEPNGDIDSNRDKARMEHPDFVLPQNCPFAIEHIMKEEEQNG